MNKQVNIMKMAASSTPLIMHPWLYWVICTESFELIYMFYYKGNHLAYIA